MALMTSLNDSAFVRIASALVAERLAATTPQAKASASDELAHMLRMAGAGRLDEYIASRDPNLDDSMHANPEETW